eukprot:scaffold9684_cov147-Skeletonema_dohrnii-CCMP3373.AAC.2
MSLAQNPTAFKHLEDVIFPKVDDRFKKSKFSHIASEKTHQVIANCRKGEAAFVYPSDFPTLSDLCFVLYHQFVPCRPPSTALIRRKTKPEKWDTLSGLCCKYYREAHRGERQHKHKGMYFPLDLQALHDSSFSHNLTDHVMTCQLVPLEIKEALKELQRLTAEHGVTTKRGTKQKFMKKLWERMANYYPAPPIKPHKKTETKTAATIGIGPPLDDLTAHVLHDSLQKRADEAAATETEAVAMNKKSSTASSDDKISPRKTSTADTSSNDVSYGIATSLNSREKKIYYCSREGCTNQVINSGVCVRHGAKVKRCSSEGCTNQVVNGGVCMRHGAKVKRCSNEGCTSQARKGGVCVRHGAKLKLCSSEGCMNQVVKGGVCIRHGAKRL